MQKYQNNVTSRTGDAVSGLQVTVSLAAGGLATIYADNAGTPKDNPITTDANGYFEFYAADGRYNVTVNGGGYEDVLIADAVQIGVEASAASTKADTAIAGLADRPTTAALAASTGAELVGVDEGTTVQVALENRVRKVETIADLRLVPPPAVGTTAVVSGYWASDDRGGGVFTWNAASTATDNGGTVITPASLPATGRWERSGDGLNVYQWGARNGIESSDAIQAAFTYVRASGLPGCVDFGRGGFFPINKPIKGTFNCHVRGSAILRAASGFSSINFDIQGGGTLTVAPILYFVDTAATTPGYAGTVGNFSGSRRYSLRIEESITIDCDDIAGVGLFLDNYFDYRLYPRIMDPTKWGVWHYSNGWGGELHPYVTGPGEGGVWLGGACNGINMSGLGVWGDNKIPSVCGVLIDGDNNGLILQGAFLEKLTKGVIGRNGCGPVDISGIDFEQIEEEVLYVDGSAVPSRISGPVTISGCFLETNHATRPLIYVNNAIVIASGNRMRDAAKAFEQVGNGQVHDDSNMIQSTVLSIGTGRIISKGIKSTRNWSETSYSVASSSLGVVREFLNHAYTYNTALASSGTQYSHAVTDVGTQRMVGSSDWFVCDMLGGAESNRMGLRLMYTGGGTNKFVQPLTHGDTDLGSTTVKLRHVRLTGGIALFDGTAVTTKPAVTGSRAGNAALASLLTALASYGLITDSTTA